VYSVGQELTGDALIGLMIVFRSMFTAYAGARGASWSGEPAVNSQNEGRTLADRWKLVVLLILVGQDLLELC
jgi:hypothetical protein